jgi:cobalt-zinc-cadmium efflux system outer membrane protein
MFKQTSILLVILVIVVSASGQRTLSENEAVERALRNARNINVANLTLTQQRQLLRGAGGIASPQLTLEKSPYEPLIVGVQQQFDWPTVYGARKQLQQARVKLAETSITLTALEIKRLVRTAYLQLQYLNERLAQLRYQDSIYKDIKAAAARNFEAGQINKLDELFAASQADRINNEMVRATADFQQQQRTLQLLTGVNEAMIPSKIAVLPLNQTADSVSSNPQIRVLEQQVEVSQRELKLEKRSLLPSINAGVLLPTTKEYENFLGYQVGISIPLWARQNRSRIAAASTGVELAAANQQNALQQLENQYLINQVNVQKEQASLQYFNAVALRQSAEIIETSRRLFAAGQISYIESLRNITSAFEMQINYLETLRNYNQAVIELNYITGNL